MSVQLGPTSLQHWHSLVVGLQEWTTERTQYLGLVLQRMLRSYTDSAVNLTTNLLSFISRFAVQVCSLGRSSSSWM